MTFLPDEVALLGARLPSAAAGGVQRLSVSDPECSGEKQGGLEANRKDSDCDFLMAPLPVSSRGPEAAGLPWAESCSKQLANSYSPNH